MEHTMRKIFSNKEINSVAFYILTSLAGGYVLSHFLIYSIPVNSDSYAPIQQAQTLIQGHATNLLSVHVARIPSLFPDLIILSGIRLLFPLRGGLELLSVYAWAYSTLFLFFSAYFVKEAIAPRKMHLLEPLSISLIIISLLAISPTARDAYGHMLTPVHHGGNILNTIAALALTLKLIKNPGSKGLLVLLCGLVIASVASNKLFLFTALIPTTCLLLTRKFDNRILGVLTLMTVTGWGLGSSLNAQCAPEIELNIITSIEVIKKYWFSYGPVIFASLFSLISIGIIYLLRLKRTKSSLTLSPSLEDAFLAFSISCLTFYIYIFLLSGGGVVTIRYALIFFSSIPIFISLLFHSITKSQKSYWLICLVGFLGAAIYRPGYVARKTKRVKEKPIHEMVISRNLKPTSKLDTTIKFLQSKNLESSLGFSDYWGAGMALESNSKLPIYPIHSPGEPDFWSLSPETLIKAINPRQERFFIISSNRDFLEKIKKNIGNPLEQWDFNKKKKVYEPLTAMSHATSDITHLLIYRDNATLQRMAEHAGLFQRNCDTSSPSYRER
jgi:hypothetical protein